MLPPHAVALSFPHPSSDTPPAHTHESPLRDGARTHADTGLSARTSPLALRRPRPYTPTSVATPPACPRTPGGYNFPTPLARPQVEPRPSPYVSIREASAPRQTADTAASAGGSPPPCRYPLLGAQKAAPPRGYCSGYPHCTPTTVSRLHRHTHAWLF